MLPKYEGAATPGARRRRGLLEGGSAPRCMGFWSERRVVVGHEVVGDPEAAHPVGLGVAGQVERLVPGVLRGDPEAEAHARRLRRSVGRPAGSCLVGGLANRR